MRNIGRCFLLCICLSFLLSSCGPIYQTNYSYVPPQNMQGRMCLNQCLALQSNCQQSCEQQQNNCEALATVQAQAQFQSYKAKQKANGQPIKKTLNDFLYDSNCYQSCECRPIYNQCYSNCGGIVNVNKTCVAFCN